MNFFNNAREKAPADAHENTCINNFIISSIPVLLLCKYYIVSFWYNLHFSTSIDMILKKMSCKIYSVMLL